jgi:uncharacterized protein YbcI
MTGPRSDEQRAGGTLSRVSSALVTLHKEQFGRGPTRARADFAGADTLVCVLEDALLPAERVMVQLGDQQRVREARAALQAATSAQFVDAIERIVNRTVVAFASAIDADQGVVWEVFNFEPGGPRDDGVAPRREPLGEAEPHLHLGSAVVQDSDGKAL